MNKQKHLHLIVLLAYPIIGAIISHLFQINAFQSVIVFFGIPSLYLTFIGWSHAKRATIFSLIVVPLIISIDYIAHLTNQWIIPKSILPRMFQYVSIEVVVWAILNFYFVVMFYEYFLHHHLTRNLYSPKIRYLASVALISFILFLAVFNFFPELLRIPYFYLCFGIILVLVPVVLQFFKYPKFISKFFEAAAYFFYLTLTYEITALQLGWWDFPGKQFIGWIYISNIRFPVEELLFWLILFSMSILSYYEYYDCEEK